MIKLDYKLITAVATEPLTTTQVKLHLKLDSATFGDDITTSQSIVPASHGAGTVTGTAVDVLGKTALINLSSGTNQATGTVDVAIQHSDDNVTYATWQSFTQVTTANDNAIQELLYTGNKRYIKAVATVANAACVFGVDVVLDSGLSDEDTLISAWISAAREYGEDYTGQAFAPQTWDMYLSDFPSEDYIEWTKGPLTSITGVYYKDKDGTQATLTVNTDYIVDTDTNPGKIFLPYGDVWPSFTRYPYNAVRIRGVCGFTGTEPYVIPKNFLQAMYVHIGLMYKYRDAEIPEAAMKTVDRLYGLRKMRWF